MTIRDYLSRAARRITDGALSDFTDAAAWRRLIPEKRRQYLEMMGLEDLPPPEERPPLNVKVTGVVERPQYRIEKLYYESLPKLYVTANLYVPKREGKFPGVVYVCGHSDTQKVHYQAHPRRFAELGFVCLIVETVQLGEVRGYHHGCYREGWFHWYSRGYTPAGIEMLNGIRGLDLLSQREDVDASKLGVTGISGGGAASWWIAAGDERIRVAAPVCGTATLASHIYDRTIDGHCDCMWWINTYRWDLADVGALIAPRPLMIASADRDGIFTIASIREVYHQLKGLYEKLGAADNLRLVETPGEHAYHERSRTAIFSWFLKHLQGKDVPPEQVGDIDQSPERQESADTLRVFVNGPLPEDRTLTIHEDFFAPPQPPQIENKAQLEETRRKVITLLKQKTFGAFPTTPPPLDVQVEFEFASGNTTGCRFAFTSEEGWRLHGRLTIANDVKRPAPVVVALRLPGEERNATESFVGRVRAPWAKVVVEPRGTGETAWGEELQWHLRRAAAWTGRTMASMRVYDVLRALAAVRSLSPLLAKEGTGEVMDGKQVSLAARGEMTAVALYAALLDGQVRTLFLASPPATQNAPSQRDGKGAAIEMLNCLRITDLPQVAGLLYPTELVFVGECPATYAWAEELYRKLGGKFRRVHDLTAWRAE
ncbi:MAG: prolyl oligopeptidase family serine peptidase [Abditibacteriales bacterium]|nr:prolyl oligopeptidase family serine peptidase [Abditibacteriales bacterium]